ncbi:hypothetical protein C723_2950 [Christiangramia flava JLT2011]|uniref:Uncharacterized protein n=1 Tax=Christiangramia flava JLT2011 TaxID=1229726 RepID=A0A1L7I0P6_9FLAO|nr:hypothetical protein GRFL_0452 [Christiangramia flava JLT2011]OSS38051.1 hypothetical protein C723_2950 [Christiangramia flava JLT2011]
MQLTKRKPCGSQGLVYAAIYGFIGFYPITERGDAVKNF